MVAITLAGVISGVTGGVTVATLIYRFLPPAEKFNDWPRFQGWYKFFTIFISYASTFSKNGNGSNDGNGGKVNGTT